MTTKKPIAKTAVTKDKTKRVKKAKPPLLVVSKEQAFYAVDGSVFYSLQDLAEALLVMDRRVYQYHADADYQDFVLWVKNVLKDETLARSLKKALTVPAAQVLVARSLKRYAT